jgi:uncharacterized protein (DUF58 family)
MTLRPGNLLIRLTLVIATAALLIPLFAQAAFVVAAAAAILAAAAAAEALLLRRVRWVVERGDDVALSLDERENISMRLALAAPVPVRVTARQSWPALVDPPSTTIRATCRPAEALPIDMTVRAIERGSATAAALYVAATRFGLVERIEPAGGETTLHVIPNLKAVQRMHKRLNQFALRSLGARAAPRIGKGREFDRLRDYLTDDDYRDIAWRATARHGRLIVQEYRLDRAQEILICLDRGHRMAARVERISRFDHAVNAALLLSYVCDRMEDKSGIVSFDTALDKGVAPARGSAHLRAVTAYVTELDAAYRYTDYLALAGGLKKRLHHRSLVLIITALPEREERHALLRAAELLAPQHLPLFLVLTDRDLRAAAEFLPASREELSRTLVARDLLLGRIELMRELRARGALVVETSPEDAGIDAVNAYIDVKKRQML